MKSPKKSKKNALNKNRHRTKAVTAAHTCHNHNQTHPYTHADASHGHTAADEDLVAVLRHPQRGADGRHRLRHPPCAAPGPLLNGHDVLQRQRGRQGKAGGAPFRISKSSGKLPVLGCRGIGIGSVHISAGGHSEKTHHLRDHFSFAVLVYVLRFHSYHFNLKRKKN